MNKETDKNYIEKIAERYFKKVIEGNNKPKNGVNNLLDEITRTIGFNSKYLHKHPLIVQWGIISNCNLRCKHCYYLGNNTRYDSSEDLSTQEALNLIDSLDELNVYNVKVTGGEPFLRKDIFEILRKLKSKNMAIAIQSNGVLINKKMAKQLGEILIPEVDNLQISLDGRYKETHELTRGKGTFDKTIEAIKNLVANNVTVYSNCTATSWNINEVFELYKMAQELKIKDFGVSQFKVCDPSQEYLVPDFEVTLKEIDRLLDIENETTYLELSVLKLYDFLNRNVGEKGLSEYADKLALDYTGQNIACQKHDRLFIKGNGNVYLCDSTAIDEFCLGNVKKEPLTEIWEHRYKNIFFQEKIYDDFPCKRCKYFSLCKGGCPMSAYKEYKTIFAPSKTCLLGAKLMQLK